MRDVTMFEALRNMKSAESNFKDISKIKGWITFVDSYLKISDQGINYYLQIKQKSNNDKYILIPIVYNLKHSLELILKTLEKLQSNKGNSCVTKSHNLHAILKNLSKKDPEIKDICEKLEGIIWQYYSLKILPFFYNQQGVPPISFEDRANTFFKYPELETEKDNERDFSVFIDFDFIMQNIDDNTFLSIQADLNEIRRIFGDVLNQISKTRR